MRNVEQMYNEKRAEPVPSRGVERLMRNKAVPTHMTNLESEIDQLNAVTETLIAALADVCRGRAPERDPAAEDEFLVPLADSIRSQTRRVAQIRGELSSILDRLEL